MQVLKNKIIYVKKYDLTLIYTPACLCGAKLYITERICVMDFRIIIIL